MADKVNIEVQARAKGEEEIDELNGKIKKLGNESISSGKKVDDLSNSTDNLGHKIIKTNSPIDGFLDKLKKFSLITAAAAGTKIAANTFISFDDQLRKVEATTGANEEQMQLLEYQFKTLGKTTRWSATEAAEAGFEFSKAGFDINQILAATPGILNTAIAGQLGLADATEITAGVLRMFKLNAIDANKVGDVLAATANSTSTDMRGLAESLKYAGKDAYDFKLSLEDTLAILGSLGNEMLKDSMAGTGLQAAFSAFKDKNKIKTLVKLGIDISNKDGTYKNFLDIIADMKAKLGNKAQIEQKIDINTIFGEQGSRVVGRLLDLNSEEFENLRQKLYAATGTSKEMAQTLEGGLGGSLRSMKSAIENLAIGFLKLAEPGLTSIINGINNLLVISGDFLDWLNSGSYAADILYTGLIALGVGYGIYSSQALIAAGITKMITAYNWAASVATSAYNLILKATQISTWATALATYGLQGALIAGTIVTWLNSQATMFLTGQIGFLTLATNILTGATGLLTGAFSLLGLPVIGVVAAITGLGAGFYFLYKKSERFRNMIDPLIDKLKSLWEWIKKFTFVDSVIKGVQSVIGKTKDILTAGGTTIDDKEQKVQEAIKMASGNSSKIEAISGKVNNFDINSILSSDKKRKSNDGYYLKGQSHNSNNVFIKSSNNVASSYFSHKEKIIQEKNYKDNISLQILGALREIKTAIEKIKSVSNKIEVKIPSELNEDELVVKLLDEIKTTLLTLA